MSVKLFQTLSDKYSEVLSKEVGVTDDSGIVIAHSNFQMIGRQDQQAASFALEKAQQALIDGKLYNKVILKNKIEFITFIQAEDLQDSKFLELFTLNILNLKSYYDEKYDKNTFVKNIVVENILPGDILVKSKELHIDYNAMRVVYLINATSDKDIHVHEIIESLFPNKGRDFVVVIDDDNVVLVKEVKNKDDYKEVYKLARVIVDTLNSELMVKAYIGIGTIIDNLKDITKSYKEAQMSMIIGNIFSGDKNIFDYNNLGMGRLIYHIPTTLCQLFLDEVFKDNSADSLDNETMLTIQKFFENNLNVSETARQLYIHRNTLVYRLEKIKRLTGLELTSFDDAVIFKVAILVKKYLANING
ncbi:transcriptional regulator, CdaR [Ruminiclostridium papyrosolvens DSM 2782]|uniref:Transcriptional regulator, CdaR n=1 Tax=Ruminiclostridium papyrosolvens DSM 2782 TaxID=588581 RepID=F1TGU0_9FIRM|nr:helix-turn-helix domain-containing protein [Ruminiclostridium papyrosolvens]EGD46421.1 transcriptional regulator, CdaR [Ruminiclostridium papyrosolvens DSM 2782]WES33966.1 helix-turn-helix domain-containing protein [Ruminiclostridium papyrosolvens DSM 2782]